jgi:hypothetical protein
VRPSVFRVTTPSLLAASLTLVTLGVTRPRNNAKRIICCPPAHPCCCGVYRSPANLGRALESIRRLGALDNATFYQNAVGTSREQVSRAW